MIKQLLFGRDSQGLNAYAPQFPTVIYTATLVTSTPEAITVPSDFSTWIMATSVQPGTYVWVSRTATAAAPVGAVFAVSASELNPGARTVFAGDVISFMTPNATCDCEVSFYPVQL